MGKPFPHFPEAQDCSYFPFLAGFLPWSVLGKSLTFGRLVFGRAELFPDGIGSLLPARE